MKLRFLFFLILALGILSCDPSIQNDELLPSAAESATDPQSGWDEGGGSSIEREIFAGAIDEWGRSSANCGGWGLCNIRACFFCCVDENYYKVDCKTQTEMVREGGIYLTGQTGYITIELNPEIAEEQAAINGELVLYVDDDIYTNDLKIHSGEYEFDSSIGGYNVNISLIN